ncbi:MAG: RNA polymerase sigma factor [Planctomycetota bacterium]
MKKFSRHPQDIMVGGNTYPIGDAPDASGIMFFSFVHVITHLSMQTPAPAIDWGLAISKHTAWLRTVIAARLQRRDAVDEVMQEVALAAVRSAKPPVDTAAVAPWLYRIAVRQALLYRRNHDRRGRMHQAYVENQDRHQATHAGNTSDTVSRDAIDPLQWMMSNERQTQLRNAMQRLPSGHRQVLMLKYANDLSYADIAKRIGATTSAVESRLHRARGALRRLLADDTHDESD